MKTIRLAYGKTRINLKVPSHVKFRVLNIKSLKPIKDFRHALDRTLDKPIGSLSFKNLFSTRDHVAIVIPDKTRGAYFPPVLEVLLDRLNCLGIDNNQIRLVVGRGLHSPHSPKELRNLMGKRVYNSVKIIDHDAWDKKNLVYLGKTSFGTKVKINRTVVESDKVITCGIIRHHYYAGFSGGRKLVLPGIAGYETIQQNHRLVFNFGSIPGKNPKASSGQLQGNPINEDMIEIARMLGVDFSINLVLNHHREYTKIFCGDIVKAHQAGCKFLDHVCSVKLTQTADCIIASTGGYPLDINFIQTHKTIDHATKALRPDGIMLVLAECSEGIGSDTFLPWFRHSTIAALEKALRKEFVVNGHTALCTLMKAQQFKIYLYSKLSDALIKRIHLNPARNLQKMLPEIFTTLPPKHTVLIIPEGSSLLPCLVQE